MTKRTEDQMLSVSKGVGTPMKGKNCSRSHEGGEQRRMGCNYRKKTWAADQGNLLTRGLNPSAGRLPKGGGGSPIA